MTRHRLGWGGARVVGFGAAIDDSSMTVAQVESRQVFRESAAQTVVAAEGMVEQAWGQLSNASTAGLSDEQVRIHQLTLQKISDELHRLHEDSMNVSEGEREQWNQRAVALVSEASGELATVVRLNQASITGGSSMGLMWGFGVAAVVAVAGYYVWRKKK